MDDLALVNLDRAKLALAECRSAMDAKQICDVAEAARVYLERTNASVETVNRATEIRLMAERQMGVFLKTMPKATGFQYGSGGRVDGLRQEPATKNPRLADIGITKQQSSDSQKLADIPADEFGERIALAKASRGKLSRASVAWSDKATKAAHEADQDSENLWKLKSIWNKTGQRDRAKFLAWSEKL